jgi:hypothetical protein
MLIIAVANQIHEMDAIRRKLWELEQSQVGMKNKSVARGRLGFLLTQPGTKRKSPLSAESSR